MAVSQEIVEMVRRIFDEAQHDPEVFFESLDDEVEWNAGAIELPDLPGSSWRGPAAVRELFRRWAGPFDELGIELVEATDMLHLDKEAALVAVGLRE